MADSRFRRLCRKMFIEPNITAYHKKKEELAELERLEKERKEKEEEEAAEALARGE